MLKNQMQRRCREKDAEPGDPSVTTARSTRLQASICLSFREIP